MGVPAGHAPVPLAVHPEKREPAKKKRLATRNALQPFVLLDIYGAPRRIRTFDKRIKSPLLCQLSYGRISSNGVIIAGRPHFVNPFSEKNGDSRREINRFWV
jgi:hypothetical protein